MVDHALTDKKSTQLIESAPLRFGRRPRPFENRLIDMLRFRLLAVFAIFIGCANTEKQVSSLPNPTAQSSSANPSSPAVIDSAHDTSAALAVNPAATEKSGEPVEVLELNEDGTTDPLALLTSPIDTTIKLGLWLKSHPADKVSNVEPVGNAVISRFCRAAVVKTRLGGRTLIRSALFYIVPTPSGERLPVDTANAAQDYCDLRTIVLESEEPDLDAGKALRDSLAELIDRRLGSHVEGLPLGAGGIRGTDEGKFWKRPATSVLVATEQDAQSGGNAADSVRHPKARTLAVSYAPGSDVADFDSWEARNEKIESSRATDPLPLYTIGDSALTWAGLPAVATDLRSVFTYLRSRGPNNWTAIKPASVDVALVRALKAIHQAAPSLPPSRRAAALLAGDVAFTWTYSLPSADSGAAIRRALPSIGITLEQDPEEGSYYAHSWLWEAYRTDSTGRAGRAAFVNLIGMRWPEDNTCSGDEYKPVIEHGEAALARGDRDPLIHYYVGSAYKTIYDLAHFSPGEESDPTPFKPQAEHARLKGIEHLREALQSLRDPSIRQAAWFKGMRLILRRSGEQPEYVCFAD